MVFKKGNSDSEMTRILAHSIVIVRGGTRPRHFYKQKYKKNSQNHENPIPWVEGGGRLVVYL